MRHDGRVLLPSFCTPLTSDKSWSELASESSRPSTSLHPPPSTPSQILQLSPLSEQTSVAVGRGGGVKDRGEEGGGPPSLLLPVGHLNKCEHGGKLKKIKAGWLSRPRDRTLVECRHLGIWLVVATWPENFLSDAILESDLSWPRDRNPVEWRHIGIWLVLPTWPEPGRVAPSWILTCPGHVTGTR